MSGSAGDIHASPIREAQDWVEKVLYHSSLLSCRSEGDNGDASCRRCGFLRCSIDSSPPSHRTGNTCKILSRNAARIETVEH